MMDMEGVVNLGILRTNFYFLFIYLLRSLVELAIVHVLIHVVIQNMGQLDDVVLAVHVLLQVDGFTQRKDIFQNVIAFLAQMHHVWIAIRQLGLERNIRRRRHGGFLNKHAVFVDSGTLVGWLVGCCPN